MTSGDPEPADPENGVPAVDDCARWDGRPGLARIVRATVFAGPLVISLLVTRVLSRLLPAPAATWPRVGWWAALLLLATVTVWASDRALRRLLPLAALLEMSVLFPGRAPSRFSIARKNGSTRQLEELVAAARESDESTEPVIAASRILALVGALRAHDKATRGHSERVRVLTDMVAEEMGLSQAARDRLRWAALLHDIGKLDVPAKILNKPGRPTVDEWERLKRHPASGEELAAPLLPWLGAAAPVIIQHHERWDGLGYPHGLRGEQICVGARIVSVADAFEVMTAARSYKKAKSRSEALREMTRMSGSQFDPAAVRALLSISAPRLRWAVGPWAWLAQLPILGTAPSLAGSVGAVAGQTAVGVGAVTLGTAVGLTSLPATTPLHDPPARVLDLGSAGPKVPAGPYANPGDSASPSPSRTAGPSALPGAAGTSVTIAADGSTASAPSPTPQRGRPVPVAAGGSATASPSASATPTPSPTPRAGRSAGPSPSPSASLSLSPSPSPTATKKGKPGKPAKP